MEKGIAIARAVKSCYLWAIVTRGYCDFMFERMIEDDGCDYKDSNAFSADEKQGVAGAGQGDGGGYES